VVITQNVNTLFIQILGINSTQQVSARAVAGYEPVGAGEGVFVLDPTAAPGLQINTNNTRLVVNGDITVNSAGGGVDQFGNAVSSSYNADAVKTSNSTTTPAPIVATTLNVVGGISNLDNVRAYDTAFSGNGYYYDPSNTDRPLISGVPTAPDPLASSSYTLPTPTTSSPNLGSPSINNNSQANLVSPNIYNSSTQTTTLNPGLYNSITINGGTVVFQPGIYVLQPPANAGNGYITLNISGGNVTGSGVMFYNTGSNYIPSTGAPDNSDANTNPTPNSTNFGAISINGSSGSSLNLSPLVDSTSPFNGILFYQRRWNTTTATFTAASGASMNFSGTLYAKWANFKLAGNGTYDAQFLVGTLEVKGGATVTINAAGKNLGKANLVFLVE
jgi:hypothetical protein